MYGKYSKNSANSDLVTLASLSTVYCTGNVLLNSITAFVINNKKLNIAYRRAVFLEWTIPWPAKVCYSAVL